ncbi:translation initiation factor eIF 4e-like domain-containing protein [Chiua virens]|nr:translation initiation factor eIF 4e-like domain-containing protein [Chiua virens]
MASPQESMSMTDALTAPLTTVSTLSNTLFQSLSSQHLHAKPSVAPPPVAAFCNAEAALARALADTASHQRRQKRIEELIAEIGAFDAKWRWIVERIEQGKRELEAVVKEGDERIEGIRKAKEGKPMSLLGSAFTSAPPNMPDPNAPLNALHGAPVPLFFPPFPNEEKMRRGRLNVEKPLGGLGESHSVKPRSPSPKPAQATRDRPGVNPYRHEVRTQTQTVFDLDLDLNPDLQSFSVSSFFFFILSVMAAYFSNHSQSQSRFASQQPQLNPSAAQNALSTITTERPRLPASRHFSTTLANRDPEPALTKTPGSSPSSGTVHPLRNTWAFWFRQQRAPGNKITNYEEGIKKVASFSSVESFWSLHTHLSPPSALVPTTDYLLFHTGVRRPVWEDPLNRAGGKWIIRLRKGIADRVWEDLVCGVVGDMFDECGKGRPRTEDDGNGNEDEDGEEWPEICGCTISVRQSEDIVSVWNRVEADMKVREKIRDTIRLVLNLPASTIMEYKSNNDSMQDKSSFRNSAIERTLPIS